jgi:hypothetical protein
VQLNYWNASWPLNEERCPCGIHLVEYVRQRRIHGQTIFHFGSGEHHILGVKNREFDRPNEILAITASKPEHDAYVELIINEPAIAQH